MCRDGLRSSPRVFAQMHKLPGLLRSPSRHKAAPTGSVPALKEMHAMWGLRKHRRSGCHALRWFLRGLARSHRDRV